MRILIACVVLALPTAAAAQGAGELWEITMNMPGMPAGMMPAQRVCGGDDPERSAKQDPGKKDCKVTDRKQSAGRTTVTMRCADGSTMTIDQQYNAGRTEFKSTMSSKGGRDGDMTMTMNGRKVGACDAVAERKARDEKMAGIQKEVAAATAAGAAHTKKLAEDTIKRCAVALDNMQWMSFGAHGQCYKKTDAKCKQNLDGYNKMDPEINKSCNTNVAEFCKRFQTQEGFVKTKADENAAQMCGVTTASIKAAQCPKAAQSGSLGFVGAYCPVQAKPIAMEHCTGRDYTSRSGGKYARFCENYLANADFERPPGAKPAAKSADKAAPSAAQKPDAVKQGMDMLKGLFGR